MNLNLIEDAWLLFRRRDGAVAYRPPAAIADPDIIDLALPRTDFQGSTWQFLIGLLQTAYAPTDRQGWLACWQSPPSEAELQQALSRFHDNFELLGDGPRFLQDRDTLAEARRASVSSLLIESPGDQGIKQNTDHFVKRGVGDALCPACAAQALMTMQMTGPAGGSGYRVGIRGGGPLTTLVLPHDQDAPLWQKLWLNVLIDDEQVAPGDDRIFPWLAATRTSQPGSATPVTTPDDAHWLQLYWAMPNRFRLETSESGGECQICGATTERLVTGVRVTNYGINYDGPWRHPLTPYRINPQKPGETLNSQKGQQGGLGYRHWEMFTLEDQKQQGNLPARVVTDYFETKQALLNDGQQRSKQPRLWVFGYDMKQNKPRGWYATEMPLVTVEAEARERFLTLVRQLTTSANRAAWHLQNAVKNAWFSRSSDIKGDFDFIQHRFWEATTDPFYQSLPTLAETAQSGDVFMPPTIAKHWYRAIRQSALEIFDDLVLAGETDALDMKRVFIQRNALMGKIANDRAIKPIRRQFEQETAA